VPPPPLDDNTRWRDDGPVVSQIPLRRRPGRVVRIVTCVCLCARRACSRVCVVRARSKKKDASPVVMIAAAAAAAAAHCCDGEELRVPGSPQPYARRVRGSWRDYLEPPGDGADIVSNPYVYDDSYDSYDDDDDDVCEEEEDSYDDSYDDDDDDEEDGDEDCSCCSLCSSGGGGRRGRDTPPTSFRSSSSSSSSSSTGSSAATKAVANTSSSSSAPPPTHRRLSPVFEPSMRGSCRCIRCQKRRYSLDFFKSSDFRRGIPSPNVYMIDERSCKIVHDYIHGNQTILL